MGRKGRNKAFKPGIIPTPKSIGQKATSSSWSVKAVSEDSNFMELGKNALEDLSSGENYQRPFQTRKYANDDRIYLSQSAWERFERSKSLEPDTVVEVTVDEITYDQFNYKSANSPTDYWSVLVPKGLFVSVNAAVEKEVYDYQQRKERGELPEPKRTNRRQSQIKELVAIPKDNSRVEQITQLSDSLLDSFSQRGRYSKRQGVTELPLLDITERPAPNSCRNLRYRARGSGLENSEPVDTQVVADDIDVIEQEFVCRGDVCKPEVYYLTDPPLELIPQDESTMTPQQLIDKLLDEQNNANEKKITVEGNPFGRIVWPSSKNSECDGLINEAVGWGLGYILDTEERINPRAAYDMQGVEPVYFEAYEEYSYGTVPMGRKQVVWPDVPQLPQVIESSIEETVVETFPPKDEYNPNPPIGDVTIFADGPLDRGITIKWGEKETEQYFSERVPIGIRIERSETEFEQNWTYEPSNATPPTQTLFQESSHYNWHLDSDIGVCAGYRSGSAGYFYSFGSNYITYTINVGGDSRTFSYDWEYCKSVSAIDEGRLGFWISHDYGGQRLTFRPIGTPQGFSSIVSNGVEPWIVDYSQYHDTRSLPTGFTLMKEYVLNAEQNGIYYEPESWDGGPRKYIFGGTDSSPWLNASMHPLVSVEFECLTRQPTDSWEMQKHTYTFFGVVRFSFSHNTVNQFTTLRIQYARDNSLLSSPNTISVDIPYYFNPTITVKTWSNISWSVQKPCQFKTPFPTEMVLWNGQPNGSFAHDRRIDIIAIYNSDTGQWEEQFDGNMNKGQVLIDNPDGNLFYYDGTWYNAPDAVSYNISKTGLVQFAGGITPVQIQLDKDALRDGLITKNPKEKIEYYDLTQGAYINEHAVQIEYTVNDRFAGKDVLTDKFPVLEGSVQLDKGVSYDITRLDAVIRKVATGDNDLVLTEEQAAVPDTWYYGDAAKVDLSFTTYTRLFPPENNESPFAQVEFAAETVTLTTDRPGIKYSLDRKITLVESYMWATYPISGPESIEVETYIDGSTTVTEVTVIPAIEIVGSVAVGTFPGKLAEVDDITNITMTNNEPLFPIDPETFSNITLTNAILIYEFQANGVGTEDNPYEVAIIDLGTHSPEAVMVRGLVPAPESPEGYDWSEWQQLIYPDPNGVIEELTAVTGVELFPEALAIEVMFDGPVSDPETGMLLQDEAGNYTIEQQTLTITEPPARLELATKLTVTTRLDTIQNIEVPDTEGESPFDPLYIAGTGIGAMTYTPKNPLYGGEFEVNFNYDNGTTDTLYVTGFGTSITPTLLNVYEDNTDAVVFTQNLVQVPTDFTVYRYDYQVENIFITCDLDEGVGLRQEYEGAITKEPVEGTDGVIVVWRYQPLDIVDILVGSTVTVTDTNINGNLYRGTYSVSRVPLFNPEDTNANEDGYLFTDIPLLAINGVDPTWRINPEDGFKDLPKFVTRVFGAGTVDPPTKEDGSYDFPASDWIDLHTYTIGRSDISMSPPRSYTDPETGITWTNGGPIPAEAITPINEQQDNICKQYRRYEAKTNLYIEDLETKLEEAIANGDQTLTTIGGDTVPIDEITATYNDDKYASRRTYEEPTTKIGSTQYRLFFNLTSGRKVQFKRPAGVLANKYLLHYRYDPSIPLEELIITGVDGVVDPGIPEQDTFTYYGEEVFILPKLNIQSIGNFTKYEIKTGIIELNETDTTNGEEDIGVEITDNKISILYSDEPKVLLVKTLAYQLPKPLSVKGFNSRDEGRKFMRSIFFDNQDYYTAWYSTNYETDDPLERDTSWIPELSPNYIFNYVNTMQPVPVELNKLVKGIDNARQNPTTGKWEIRYRIYIFELTEELHKERVKKQDELLTLIENYNYVLDDIDKEDLKNYNPTVPGLIGTDPKRYDKSPNPEPVHAFDVWGDPREKLQIIVDEGTRYKLTIAYDGYNFTEQFIYDNYDPTSNPDLFFIEQLPYLRITSYPQDAVEGTPPSLFLDSVESVRCYDNPYIDNNIIVDSVDVEQEL